MRRVKHMRCMSWAEALGLLVLGSKVVELRGIRGLGTFFCLGVLPVQVFSCVSLRQWPLEHLTSALLR